MAKERIKARNEQRAAERAEAQRRKRRNKMMWRVVGGLIAVSAAVSVGYCVVNDRQLSGAVTTATYPHGMHRGGQITYKESPPLGGAHNVVWQNCGIYDVPIHDEHAVHSLEHGAVWITYRPGLPADAVQRLKVLAAADFMLLSPYPGLRAPVVASAWNNQIALDQADERQLARFISKYKNNPATTPEFGAPCSGGTSASAEANSLDTGPGPMAR